MKRGGYVYIMSNKHDTVLYVGVTSDLRIRVEEHKNHKYPNSFTSRYNLHKLVYFEGFTTIKDAIEREKQLKAGSRKKKINLIDSFNHDWKDLYADLTQ
jgi:putative endonuclease